MKNAYLLLMVMIMSLFIVPSCKTSNATKGAVIGAGAGAAAGAVLAKKNKAAAIIFGAAVGGVAGGLIGHYMDKQAEKIREDLQGAKVERVGEGILVTFDSGLLFDVNSSSIKSETQANLARLSNTLNKYDDTDVRVLGHTDATGTDSYNMSLSKRRASSVKSYLVTEGVTGSRMSTTGYGETDPVATNETEEGRQLNRRVEIVIVANEKLKRDAKKGKIPEA